MNGKNHGSGEARKWVERRRPVAHTTSSALSEGISFLTNLGKPKEIIVVASIEHGAWGALGVTNRLGQQCGVG